ncbi:MAG TPA: LytTR family DNA-binding domain-containing protein [Chitinophagaceae bacterium]|jgi:DNA-binding LytR/AlgR family response regulator|nr:LytTR family DNA-binding domain-containing protein [Chitinophagaceae bacterium]
MNVVIIEDEKLIAEELQHSIELVASDVEILDVLSSLKAARKWFMEHKEPDIIFMDIKLSDGLSFELFEQFSLQCPVIFTTAYEEYAIRAFKVNGVDYLLKPVQEEDLKKAIDKCRSMIENKSFIPGNLQQLLKHFTQPGAMNVFKEKFIVNFNNKWMPVDTKDIAAFQKDNLNYIYTFSGEKYIYDFSPLEEIEELLDSKIFFRANRQVIINIDAVHSVKPHGNQKLAVQLKAPLKLEVDISREKAPLFRKWIDR